VDGPICDEGVFGVCCAGTNTRITVAPEQEKCELHSLSIVSQIEYDIKCIKYKYNDTKEESQISEIE
jgi:hypothetical protein